MKIRNQISLIVLPLIIVPLVLTGIASSFAARNGITQVITDFLSFKAEELHDYAASQWELLVDNDLESNEEFVSVAQSAVASFAASLVRDDTERIFALSSEGTIDFSTGEIDISENERDALLDLLTRGSTGWHQIDIGGVSRVAQVLPFEPFGWYLFITQMREVFYNPVDQIYLQTAVILSFFLIVSVVLLVVFTGHFTKPLRNIAGAMKRIITTNDLSHKVDIPYHDETGDLGHSFNLMTEELQNAYDQMKVYALEKAVSQKKEEKIRHVFQKYVPKDVIERYLASPESMLVGEDRLLAVLFSDIREFTSISERMEPGQIVESLNRYFSNMVNVIMENGGIVDKYIGDAIMAFFGAPVRHEDDTLKALESGFQMLDALEKFNDDQVRRGERQYRIGIGINYGLVTVGNIGSERKMDYTVIGDIVNLTSRLEGLTKVYGENFLISESMYRKVIHKYPCRMIDRVAVKGKSVGMGIYTPRRSITPEEERAWKLHHAGLIYYYHRRFDQALSYFTKVLELLPEDPASELFSRRCEELIAKPPAEEWDGIVHMTEK
ncbi:MAG: adenylate/guanylate cyclase domain-containing protein [Spirochaetota bacterium]